MGTANPSCSGHDAGKHLLSPGLTPPCCSPSEKFTMILSGRCWPPILQMMKLELRGSVNVHRVTQEVVERGGKSRQCPGTFTIISGW